MTDVSHSQLSVFSQSQTFKVNGYNALIVEFNFKLQSWISAITEILCNMCYFTINTFYSCIPVPNMLYTHFLPIMYLEAFIAILSIRKPSYSHADNPIMTTVTNVYSEYRGIFTEFRYGRLKNISELQTSIKYFTTSSDFMQIKQIINVLGYNTLFSRQFSIFILIRALIRKPVFLWPDKYSKRCSTAAFRNFTCTRCPSELQKFWKIFTGLLLDSVN